MEWWNDGKMENWVIKRKKSFLLGVAESEDQLSKR
jgi:hypothetical protein